MDPAFEVHMLNAGGIEKAQKMAASFDQLLSELYELSGSAVQTVQTLRPMAIVRTKLEEACFFAKKAMASNPANQKEN